MHTEIHAEVVVLGSGPSGYSAAFRCADLGLDTVLIERYDALGGVCLNVGCIPSKALLHIAKVIQETKELSASGILSNTPNIDCDKIRLWKNQIICKLTDGLSSMRKKRKIRIIHGHAYFETDHSIVIDKKHEKITIFFQNAIIATGSKPIQIPSLPNNDIKIWDSTDALLLNSIPRRFLIIGGGIIGLEMATIYSSLGSKVDIVDRFKQFLPFIDTDISDIYINSIKSKFNLMLNTHVDEVKLKNQEVIVNIMQENMDKYTGYYDAILVAIGRTPNIEGLNLNKIGLTVNNLGFIEVDKQLRTNIPQIYAIGDVIGPPMLAHKGSNQGHIVAEVISGKKHYFEPTCVPSVIYSDPELAWVGLNEVEAKKLRINYEVSCFPWNALGRSLASNCTQGVTKLIFDKDSNRIIGGSVIGVNAGELINEITLAIEMGCDAEDIALTIHAHPTLSESISLSASIYQGTITDILNVKRQK